VLAELDRQTRRSIALLMRHQLGPSGSSGREYLLADPAAVDGAMPGSEVDWQLRIDYAQHAGSALLRWLELRGRPPEGEWGDEGDEGKGKVKEK
jgi:hypothetical protein